MFTENFSSVVNSLPRHGTHFLQRKVHHGGQEENANKKSDEEKRNSKVFGSLEIKVGKLKHFKLTLGGFTIII